MENNNRIPSIDRLRGFIVFCMIFFICAAEFPSLGFLARVANNSTTGKIMLFNGMSLADICDPIFLFIISLSYELSFRKRIKEGKKKTILHFLIRYLSFMGIGSMMVTIEDTFLNGLNDPTIIQTILCYLVVGLTPFLIITLLVKKIPRNINKYIKYATVGSLMILGVLGIVFGIYDDIVIFSGSSLPLYKHWSILHEIGFSGLLLLPFMFLPTNKKMQAWLCIVFAYAGFALLPNATDCMSVVVLGGLFGCIGWLILMLGGTIFVELFMDEKKRVTQYVAVFVLTLITTLSCIFLPLNIRAVTINYSLFCLNVVIIAFMIINLFNKWQPKFAFFTWWGRNTIIIFLIALVLKLILLLWNPADDTPFIVGFVVTFGSAALMTFIAYILNKKKINFRF